jgi:hypothetical protein
MELDEQELKNTSGPSNNKSTAASATISRVPTLQRTAPTISNYNNKPLDGQESKIAPDPLKNKYTAAGTASPTPALILPVLQLTASVISVEDDENNTGLERESKNAPATHSNRLINMNAGNPKFKPAPLSAPLSALKVYVIPTHMDQVVFKTMRERVIQLQGEWLGPKTKTLAMDPRKKPDVPALDQDRTTHIVTALNSIKAVKQFLDVEEINVRARIFCCPLMARYQRVYCCPE